MSGLESRLTRRTVLKTIGLAFAAIPLSCESVPPAKVQRAMPKLYQARTGEITPDDYLTQLIEFLPESASAKKEGRLASTYFEPADLQVEQLLRNLFSARVFDSSRVQFLVESNFGSYLEARKKKAAAVVVPSRFEVIGQSYPRSIIFTNEILKEKSFGNDDEIKLLVGHEMQHINDLIDGIVLESLKIPYYAGEAQPFSFDFYDNLLEIRARYKDLVTIFYQKTFARDFPFRPEFVGRVANNYAVHWEFLKNNFVPGIERRTADLQLAEFKGIVVQRNQNGLYLQFNLFGKSNNLKIG